MNFQLDLLGLFDPLKVVGSDSDLQCKHPKKNEKKDSKFGLYDENGAILGWGRSLSDCLHVILSIPLGDLQQYLTA